MIQSSFLKRSALRFSGFTNWVLLPVALLRFLRGGSSDTACIRTVEGEGDASLLTSDMFLDHCIRERLKV
jgi:hypothetical protein